MQKLIKFLIVLISKKFFFIFKKATLSIEEINKILLNQTLNSGYYEIKDINIINILDLQKNIDCLYLDKKKIFHKSKLIVLIIFLTLIFYIYLTLK